MILLYCIIVSVFGMCFLVTLWRMNKINQSIYNNTTINEDNATFKPFFL